MPKYTGYIPQDYQREVHNAISSYFEELKTTPRHMRKRHIYTVKSPRQVGKSLLVENELLRFAINIPDSTSIVVFPTLDQSRKMFKELQKACHRCKLIASANNQLLNLEFNNGSTILFKSAEQRESLRGFTVTGILILDEAAYISDEVFNIIRPATNAHKTPILLTSTPRLKTGFFYECYMKGLDDANDNYHSFNFNDYNLSKFLPDDLIEDYRLSMPSSQFKTEIKGEFIDMQGMLFDGIDKNNLRVLSQNKSGKLYAGIDWASGTGNDSTVLTILNEDLEYVELEAFNDKDTTQTIDIITKRLQRYDKNNIFIYSEDNGIGKPMNDLLVQKLNFYNIKRWTTSNKSKTEQVKYLQVAFESGLIKILNNSQLKLQLSAYEGKYNPNTGNISYNAPQGLHDDYVMSLMLAMQAYQDKKNSKLKYTFK